MKRIYIILPTLLTIALFGCEGNQESVAKPVQETPETHKESAHTESNAEEAHTTGHDASDHAHSHEEGGGKTYELTLANIALEVRYRGDGAPGSALDVSLITVNGERPATIRVWVGVESGKGSRKTKVHSHGATYHAHAAVPSDLPEGSALWIEVQTLNGEKESGSIDLQ